MKQQTSNYTQKRVVKISKTEKLYNAVQKMKLKASRDKKSLEKE